MLHGQVIAVTGLNATDNPGPGVSVIRSLRHHPDFRGRIVGLCYDALEPGIFAPDLVDDIFLIPYPSQGVDSLRQRLGQIRDRIGITMVIPSLDAELPGFIALADELKAMGVASMLPTRRQLDQRAKANLGALGATTGLPVAESHVVTDTRQLAERAADLGFPVVVKGPYYGATVARSLNEATIAFHRSVAEWGHPVIVQRFVRGQELCVVAVGDGRGGLIGAMPMCKRTITDKGKGWAGIAIKDPALSQLAVDFMAASVWRGPCELEVLRDHGGGMHLLEINPRFPAWVYLSAGAGMNLPIAVARLAAGEKVARLTDYRVGTMFVRIAIDQVATLEDLQRISTTGEIVRSEGGIAA